MPNLNNRVLQKSGKFDTTNNQSDGIIALRTKEKELQARLSIGSASRPSLTNLKTCDIKLINQEVISMVKPSSTLPQGARRQMAGASIKK